MKMINLLNKIRLRNISSILSILLLVTVCVVIILLPQMNNDAYVNSTVISKTIFLMKGMVVIVSLCLLYLITLKEKIVFNILKLDISLLVLVCYIVVNRYIIQDVYGFSIRFVELMLLSVLYLVCRMIPKKNYPYIFIAVAVSGIAQAVYGNLQLLDYYPSNHSGFKMTGSFFNPGPYAGFLAVVWPICLGMYLFSDELLENIEIEEKFKVLKTIINYVLLYIPLIGMVTIFLVVPASQSRAAWLSVLVSSFALLEYKYKYIKGLYSKTNKLQKIIVLGFALSVLAIGLINIVNFKKDSANGRLFIWKVTANMVADFPVFGVGFDRFKAHYMNYQAGYFNRFGEDKYAGLADNTSYTFNEFLQFFAESGGVGLLLLSVLIYGIIQTPTNNEYKQLIQMIKTVFIAVGIFAMFSYPIQILPIKLVLILSLAVVGSLGSKYYKFKRINIPQPYLLKPVCIVLLIGICCFGITKENYTTQLSNSFKAWGKALDVYNYGHYEESLNSYKEAYGVLGNNGDFLTNYGKALMMAEKVEESLKVLNKAKKQVNTTILQTTLGDVYKGLEEYNKAEIAYNNAYDMIPARFYPLYLLAKNYEENKDTLKAKNMAKRILNKEIKIPSTAIEEIKIKMKEILSKNNKPLGL